MPELSKLIAFVSAAITVFVQGEAGGEGTESVECGLSGPLLLPYSTVY